VALPGIEHMRQVVGRSRCCIQSFGRGWEVDFKVLRERAVIEFQ